MSGVLGRTQLFRADEPQPLELQPVMAKIVARGLAEARGFDADVTRNGIADHRVQLKRQAARVGRWTVAEGLYGRKLARLFRELNREIAGKSGHLVVGRRRIVARQ